MLEPESELVAGALVADRVNDFGPMVLEVVRIGDPHDAGHLEWDA
jgi:hypothetical protein